MTYFSLNQTLKIHSKRYSFIDNYAYNAYKAIHKQSNEILHTLKYLLIDKSFFLYTSLNDIGMRRNKKSRSTSTLYKSSSIKITIHINQKNNNGVCTICEYTIIYKTNITSLQHNNFKLTSIIWHYTFNNS